MQHRDRWLGVTLVLASIPFAAGAPGAATTAGKDKPAHVEHIEGSALSRVILTEKALKRLGIQTAPARDEMVTRTRVVMGQVLEAGAGGTETFDRPLSPGVHSATAGAAADVSPTVDGRRATDPPFVLVRVNLAGDAHKIARDRPARVRPLAGDDGSQAWPAEPVDGSGAGWIEQEADVLYLSVSGTDHGFVPKQPVLVELDYSAGEASRKVVPVSAVIYDPPGEAWVYTNPEPLTFVRQQVNVDYLDDDEAVLSDGPAAGTAVVTVGAPLLLGTEFEIGH